MAKYILQFEIDDIDFEPGAYGCEMPCPFSYWDYYNDDGWTCSYQTENCPFLVNAISEMEARKCK